MSGVPVEIKKNTEKQIEIETPPLYEDSMEAIIFWCQCFNPNYFNVPAYEIAKIFDEKKYTQGYLIEQIYTHNKCQEYPQGATQNDKLCIEKLRNLYYKKLEQTWEEDH